MKLSRYEQETIVNYNAGEQRERARQMMIEKNEGRNLKHYLMELQKGT